MNLRRQAAARYQVVRLAGAAGCGLAGAVILGSVAVADGVGPVPWAVIGAAAGSASGWLLRGRRSLSCEIDPATDPAGTLRAALSIPADHPFAERINAEARGVPLRFRPLGELRALGIAAAVALLFALWTWSAPAVDPAGALAADAPAGRAPGRAPSADPAAPVDLEEASGAQQPGDSSTSDPSADVPGQSGDGAGAGSGGWKRLPMKVQSGSAFTAGRDFGDAHIYVLRYLRLKAERKE